MGLKKKKKKNSGQLSFSIHSSDMIILLPRRRLNCREWMDLREWTARPFGSEMVCLWKESLMSGRCFSSPGFTPFMWNCLWVEQNSPRLLLGILILLVLIVCVCVYKDAPIWMALISCPYSPTSWQHINLCLPLMWTLMLMFAFRLCVHVLSTREERRPLRVRR